MKFKLDKLMKNKFVLFIIFFLSLVTIFGYLVKQNYQAILFFTLVLFLTKHFSNNMIVILGVSIIATNLLDLFRIFSIKNLEGLENNEDKAIEKQPSAKVQKVLQHIANEYCKDEEIIEGIKSKSLNDISLSSINFEKVENKASIELETIKDNVDELSYSDIIYLLDLSNLFKYYLLTTEYGKTTTSNLKNIKMIEPIINKGIDLLQKAKRKKVKEEKKKFNEKELTSNEKEQTPSEIDDEFNLNECPTGEVMGSDGKCIKPSTKKESMTTLFPAQINEKKNSGAGNIDIFNDAKSKELAFDNIDKIFGNDKVRSMKSEATSLHERQNKIMDQIKEMGPIMNKAIGLIKNVDMDSINSITDKMGGMIDNLQQLKN